MSLSARKLGALVVSALLLAAAPACSRQGEGERCDREAAGDSDCEPPLVCVDFTPSATTQNKIQRCCPLTGVSSDRRCDRSSIVASLGGNGNTPLDQNPPDDTGTGGTNAGAGGSDE